MTEKNKTTVRIALTTLILFVGGFLIQQSVAQSDLSLETKVLHADFVYDGAK